MPTAPRVAWPGGRLSSDFLGFAVQTQERSAGAAVAASLPSSAAGAAYHFVYLDLAGRFHATDQQLIADDEAAQTHAQCILAGATLVVVYRNGAKVSLLANLC
jgi:hypothetical protein